MSDQSILVDYMADATNYSFPNYRPLSISDLNEAANLIRAQVREPIVIRSDIHIDWKSLDITRRANKTKTSPPVHAGNLVLNRGVIERE